MFTSIRPDYSHPSRFLASLGVGLIAFGLAVPWLVGKATTVLLMPEDDFYRLSPEARDAVVLEQEHSTRLLNISPWVMVAGVVLGLALVVSGLIWWTQVQRGAESREKEKHEFELRFTQASPGELDARLHQEASDLGAREPDGVAGAGSEGPGSEATLDGSSNEAGEDSLAVEQARTSYELRREAIKRVERAVLERVAHGFESSHRAIRGARLEVSSPSDRLTRPRLVDILLVPHESANANAFVIDVKYVSAQTVAYQTMPTLAAISLALASERVAGAGTYRGPSATRLVRDTRCVAVGVVVVANDARESVVSGVANQWSAVSSVLKRPVGAVILSEEELLGDADLVSMIRSALSSGRVIPAGGW